MPNYVSAQKPSGSRPPQDTLKYVGLFDITPDETEEDYNTYIFSPIDNRAAYIGSLSDAKRLRSILSKIRSGSFYHLLLRKIALFRMFKSGCRMTQFSQKCNKFGVYMTKLKAIQDGGKFS